MALEMKLGLLVKHDISEIYVTDETGAYSVNNIGGYGTPNIDRGDYAQVLLAKRIKYKGDPELVSLNTAYVDYDPAYTNSKKSLYSLEYKEDGWYQFYLVLVPIAYETAQTDDIRYNPSLSRLEIYTNDWVELENEDIENLIGGNYIYGFEEEIFQLNLIKQKNCVMEDYIDCIQCSTCKCNKLFEQLSKIKVQIQAIDYIFYSNKKYEAVKLLERSGKEFNCCK